MLLLKKLILILAPLSILGYIFYYTEPPASWQQASTVQILGVFIPLMLLFTFLIDLFLNYLPRSFVLGLGVLMLVVLWVSDFFNIYSVPVVIIVTSALFVYIPKSRLTTVIKIPKLTRIR